MPTLFIALALSNKPIAERMKYCSEYKCIGSLDDTIDWCKQVCGPVKQASMEKVLPLIVYDKLTQTRIIVEELEPNFLFKM